jgi:type I restriction enzyme S subunit
MNREEWSDGLPTGWPEKRLKYIAPASTARADANASEAGYIGLENIESWTGRLIESEPTQENDDETESSGTAGRFVRGDVLFGKLRPYLAKAFLADREGVCSTELLALRPTPEIDGRYLRYFLLCPHVISVIDSSTFGAKMPRANWDFIGGLRVPIPEITQQQKIADYLDAETAEIDALIAEKDRMLCLLEEKRAALATHAVTHGLVPQAKLVPSCVEWLGDIPQSWTTYRFKHLFRIRDDRSEDGSEELLTVSHISGVTPRTEKTVYMFKAESMAGYKRCFPGDLITNTLWAFMGALGVAREPGIVSPDYHVYEPNNLVDSEYLDLLVRSEPFKIEILRHSKGVWSSRLRLYPEEFLDIRFPLPSVSEQKRTAEKFRQSIKRDELLKVEIEQSIQLLRERRSALITAAVTGQISVEKAAT